MALGSSARRICCSPFQFTKLLIVTVLTFGFLADAALSEPASRYIRRSETVDTVTVFVHGVLGDSIDTWTKGSSYWPDILAKDATFNNSNIFVYQYPTSMWATLSIDELAENMRLQLAAYDVSSHSRIVFVVHSMGGLVTRAYLLKNRGVAERTKFAYFFSTPTTGSEVAQLATLILRNPQLSKMQSMRSADYLADLQRQWLSAEFRIPSYCAYEKRKTYGLEIVTQSSAASLCNKRLDPIDADHLEIVKPSDENDIPHLALKVAFKEQIVTRAEPLKASLMEEFQKALNALNRSLISRDENLFPALDRYLETPTQRNWTIVREAARLDLEQVRTSVQLAMNFDSQFYEVGDKILSIASDGTSLVDRRYQNAFRDVRIMRGGANKPTLDDILEVEDRPTVEQVREWRTKLKETYSKLQFELRRLIVLVQQRT